MDDNTTTQEREPDMREIAKPDQNWSRTQPIHLVATKAQLDMPHSVCDMRNTDRQQTHVVIDRHNTGHEIRPGQTVHGIEMVDSHLDYFKRQRQGNRQDHLGRPMPPHPVIIEGARQMKAAEDRPEKLTLPQQPRKQA